MKSASIVSIGNEILHGQTLDTNASYLSHKLLSMGLPVVGWHAAADDVDSIAKALRLASEEADIVLVTGGLGPTDDDVTREGLAKLLNVSLEFHKELLEKIEAHFSLRNAAMPSNNRIQAFLPAGTRAIENKRGTAPGIMAQLGAKPIFVLPGVPGEMKEMFEELVEPQLVKFAVGQAVAVQRLRCFGAGESAIAELLGDIMRRGRNPQVNCTVASGIITLHIIATAEDKLVADEMAQADEKFIKNILGDLVFGEGEQTLARVVGEELTKRKQTVATAESCTGGLLAKLITDIPGASEYFTYGWVTYSNNAKTTELGVTAELIEKHGAVSEQVAAVMAEQARQKARSDFAISITGIAGPTGGTKDKPVGLVFIGLSDMQEVQTKRFIFSADREAVRMRAALAALNTLRLKLKI
jgi:nicotinamide-nucleotide amidase